MWSSDFWLGPLRGQLSLQQPLVLPGWNSHCFSQSDVVRASFSSTGAVGSGAQCGNGIFCSSGGTRYSSQFFLNFYTWVLHQFILSLCPSYQSQHGFFIFLVIIVLFSSFLGGSQGWLFYDLFVSLMWLWEKISTAFTYSAILTRSVTIFKILYSKANHSSSQTIIEFLTKMPRQ